jgi:phosphoenolpyruvate carboxykinase (ATP)
LDKAEYGETDIFKLKIPKGVTNVPQDILDPARSWQDKEKYRQSLTSLAESFQKNFKKYRNEKSDRLFAGGPQL